MTARKIDNGMTVTQNCLVILAFIVAVARLVFVLRGG